MGIQTQYHKEGKIMIATKIDMSQLEHNPIEANLIYVTEAQSGAGWHSTPHIHPFAEIFYVTKGNGQFWIEEEVYPVVEDDIIFINSNVNHTEMKQDDNEFNYIVLGVSGISFDMLKQNDFSIYNYHQHKHEILYYLKEIVREARQKEEHYQAALLRLLDLLLINLTRRVDDLSLSNVEVEKISLECAFVMKYIDKNYQERITLDSLAKLTHTSKYYLSHAFKEYNGQSIIDYLIDRRIKEASILLRTTNHPIGAIAQMVGYETTSYFSSAFKNRMKMSPLNYRKLNS